VSGLQDFVQQRAFICTRVELMLSTGLFGVVTAITVIGLAGPVHADRIADASSARIVDRSELAWNDGKLLVLTGGANGLRVPIDRLFEPMQGKLIGAHDHRARIRATQRLCGSAASGAGSMGALYKATSSTGELTCY
jgi:hypothetical protein